MSDDLNLEGVIDLLIKLLSRQFANDVSSIYFGDIGMYPPNAFRDERGNWMPILAVEAVSNRKMEGGEVAAFEYRVLEVDVIVYVNMTPYFEAAPKAAFGERMLVRTSEKIRAYLAQLSNITFGRRVSRVLVRDVDYAPVYQPKNTYLRAAGIRLEVTIKQDKLLV